MKKEITPMMKQYVEIKSQHPNDLLFYRMGDFYEMFFDDAITASKALDIALTHRGKDSNDSPIPMCGVPFHSVQPYLNKLISAGFRVAICEQMESPEEAKKRGYSSVVKREVVRILSSGTLTEETLLDQGRPNYLFAFLSHDNTLVFSWLDLSTGHFFCETSKSSISDVLERIDPSEILITENHPDLSRLTKAFPQISFTRLPESRFHSPSHQTQLEKALQTQNIFSLGDFTPQEISVAGVLVDYVVLTSKSDKVSLRPLQKTNSEQILQVDATTRKSLELTHSLSGERDTTLFQQIDFTRTPSGRRLLKRFFDHPLTHIPSLRKRYDFVDFFLKKPAITSFLAKSLSQTCDIERILSRIVYDRANPRDLGQLRETLSLLPAFMNAFEKETHFYDLSPFIEKLNALTQTLQRSLQEDLPYLARSGNLVRDGYDSTLDEMRTLAFNGTKIINQLQEHYRKQSHLSQLRIKSNGVLGYYIEVSPKNSDYFIKPENGFIHRQTLASAVRFTTAQLSETESKLKGAEDKALAIEIEIFDSLCETIKKHQKTLSELAQTLAEMDVFSGFANLASEKKCVRPVLTEGLDFDIQGGRHLVVESFLRKEGAQSFIPNNCRLEKTDTTGRLWLITGPNMAGKSTFLRQNALIVFLAHIGCFVPADSATIGWVDKIFSRVGASDNLAKGQSTFMTEMVETASILNQATPRSLVILDEIGRGTATFDGLSIAWAVVEHLHNINQSRGLFATHYHELTTLANDLDHLSCHTSTIREWEGEIVFLHEIKDGTADKSYGIHVAKLAGIPKSVLSRAKHVLEGLENQDRTHPLDFQHDLFTQAEVAESKPSLLDTINPDTLSPKEALDLIYKLKAEK